MSLLGFRLGKSERTLIGYLVVNPNKQNRDLSQALLENKGNIRNRLKELEDKGLVEKYDHPPVWRLSVGGLWYCVVDEGLKIDLKKLLELNKNRDTVINLLYYTDLALEAGGLKDHTESLKEISVVAASLFYLSPKERRFSMRMAMMSNIIGQYLNRIPNRKKRRAYEILKPVFEEIEKIKKIEDLQELLKKS